MFVNPQCKKEGRYKFDVSVCICGIVALKRRFIAALTVFSALCRFDLKISAFFAQLYCIVLGSGIASYFAWIFCPSLTRYDICLLFYSTDRLSICYPNLFTWINLFQIMGDYNIFLVFLFYFLLFLPISPYAPQFWLKF